ncbi:MAG: hypothetical protein FJ215_04130 [Ignavibacteria bacterium]|nr:hypothetical protein [Ignavibacteria bacterium]
MASDRINTLAELVESGEKLAPLGGFEHSGFNARLQDKYAAWRKSCIEFLDAVGPVGFAYKNKITADPNGGQFFQASALLILKVMKELLEKSKTSPEILAESVKEAAAADSAKRGASGATRVLKPPTKREPKAVSPQESAASGDINKVYVIGDAGDPLRAQLSQLLAELGIEEVPLEREHGKMLGLESVEHDPMVRCAFFVFDAKDLTFAMFEVGHFVGKLGNGKVFVLHMSDVEFPKGVPGVIVKPIVVKLEEAALSLIRELKNCGYKISL